MEREKADEAIVARGGIDEEERMGERERERERASLAWLETLSVRGSRGPLDRRQPSREAETITQHQIQRTEMEGCTAARGHRGRERASKCGREGGRSGSGTKERSGEKGGGRDKETGFRWG